MIVTDLLEYIFETYVGSLCLGKTAGWAFFGPPRAVPFTSCRGEFAEFSRWHNGSGLPSSEKDLLQSFALANQNNLDEADIVVQPDCTENLDYRENGLRSLAIRTGRAAHLKVEFTDEIIPQLKSCFCGDEKVLENETAAALGSHTAANLHLFRKGCEGHRRESRLRSMVGIVATQHINHNAFICCPSSWPD